MEYQTCEFQMSFNQSGKIKPSGEIAIFSSPSLKKLIVAVDCNEIAFEKGHITPKEQAAFTTISSCKEFCKHWYSKGILTFIFYSTSEISNVTQSLALAQHIGQGSSEISPTTFEIATDLSKIAMIFNEKRMHDYIAINLDDIIARRCRHALVTHHSKTEPIILVPQMNYRNRTDLPYSVNYHTCICPGSVIAYYYFVRQHFLVYCTQQT